MCRVKSANRYWEYDASTCVFGKLRKIKVWILNSRTRETWNFEFRDTYLAKTCHFWRNTRVFNWNREFLINFGPKTFGCCSSCVSEASGAWNSWKRRFVHQSTGLKKTLPAGLAQHVPVENLQSLFIIWNRVYVFQPPRNAPTYSIFMHQRIFNSDSNTKTHFGASP